MLDRLPPELLLDIFKLASSPMPHENGYKQRARTLNSLCLASRSLRELVQPMLWEVVQVEGRDAVDKLREAMKEKAYPDTTHTLVINYALRNDSLVGIVEGFPRLERLKLFNRPLQSVDIPFDLLKAYTSLRQLSISSAALHFVHPLVFPHLVDLSLHDVWTKAENLNSLLTTSCLPCLKALAIGDCFDFRTGRIDLDLSDSFLGRLDAVQLEVTQYHRFPHLIGHPVIKVLVVDGFNLFSAPSHQLPSSPFHLLFDDIWSRWTLEYHETQGSIDAAVRSFRQVAAAVPTWTGLQAVFLPCSEPPSSPSPGYGWVRDELLEACKAANVEVRWRQEPFSANDPWTFSLDFLGYARRKKAEAAMKRA